MASKKTQEVFQIEPIKTRNIILHVVGTSPFIMHRFAKKAWQEMLYPAAKKNRNEKESTLKHDPLLEFRESCYICRDPKAPALFHIPNNMLRDSMATAAVDIPGAAKAELKRLVACVNETVYFYGIPSLGMNMVKEGGMTKTPNVRTRAFFQRWACSVEFRYKVNPLTDSQIINLFGAAGQIIGIGDWRPQKGGQYGTYRVCSPNDKEYQDIIKKENRATQQLGYDHPDFFDNNTEELMSWYTEEVARRRQDNDGEQLQTIMEEEETVQ